MQDVHVQTLISADLHRELTDERGDLGTLPDYASFGTVGRVAGYTKYLKDLEGRVRTLQSESLVLYRPGPLLRFKVFSNR